MADFYERIVDVEVTGEEAGSLAERMIDLMVAEDLVTRETSGEGVYSANVDVGHIPGRGWARAAEPWGSDHRPGPVAVVVGRSHHVGGQGMDEAEYAECPRCGARTVIIDYPLRFEADQEVWRPYREAIAAWRETGEGSVSCSACGASVPVTEWRWDSGFAVGALAFEFWGWPPLTDEFHEEFGRRLGHRTVIHQGKF
ncbi:hypothetical protein E1265_18615 [Streptomyces sp. 8K308]|uniref:hypothetical protein n=1 Tax=Streptomyces sp. 8K308 TaxID=2530388 RepID=UPI0010431D99|nr:hypothetical protein [Streptomyces sp. 8K308]TDC21219.1 hypothetical protein E1265_18615 [Streptomyces sp. 8K308]